MQNYLAAKNAVWYAFIRHEGQIGLLTYTAQTLSGKAPDESPADLGMRAAVEAELQGYDPNGIVICERDEALRDYSDVLAAAFRAMRDQPPPVANGEFKWVHRMQLHLAPREELTDPGYRPDAVFSTFRDRESVALESPWRRPLLWVLPTDEEIDIEGQQFPIYRVHHGARLFDYYRLQTLALDWIPVYVPAVQNLTDLLMQALFASRHSFNQCRILQTLHDQHHVSLADLMMFLPGTSEETLRHLIAIARLPERMQQWMPHSILSFSAIELLVRQSEDLSITLEPVLEWARQEDATSDMVYEIMMALKYGDAGVPVTLSEHAGKWLIHRGEIPWNPFATQQLCSIFNAFYMTLTIVSDRLKDHQQWTPSRIIADLVHGQSLPREHPLVVEHHAQGEIRNLEELFQEWQTYAVQAAHQDIAFYLRDSSDQTNRVFIDELVVQAGLAFCAVGLLTHDNVYRVSARYDLQAVHEAVLVPLIPPAVLVTVDRWHSVLSSLPAPERAEMLLHALQEIASQITNA